MDEELKTSGVEENTQNNEVKETAVPEEETPVVSTEDKVVPEEQPIVTTEEKTVSEEEKAETVEEKVEAVEEKPAETVEEKPEAEKGAKKEKAPRVPFKELSPKDKAKRVLTIAGNVLQILIVILAITISIVVIVATTTRNRDELPADPLFGLAFMTVQSGSMDGNADFYKEHPDWSGFAQGDLIVVKAFDAKKNSDKVFKVGDVVTVYMQPSENSSYILNTHRIIEVKGEGANARYVLKGDANVFEDKDFNGNERLFTSADIKGVWGGAKISGFGKAMDWLKQPTQFLLCIVLPLAILFLVNLFFFIRAILRNKMDKTEERLKAEKAADVQAAIDALIKRQQEEQAKAATVTPAATAAAPVSGGLSPEERERLMNEERARILEEERVRARVYEEELAKIREEAREQARKELEKEKNNQDLPS